MPFDCFVEIGDIPGESTDEMHDGWIEALSYSHGVSQTLSGDSRSSGGGASGGGSSHQNFSFVHQLDKASPKLAIACCKGVDIGTVTIELCRQGGDKICYMKYVLEGVVVASVSPGGSSGGSDGVPLEEVSLNYGKITWTYTETDHETGEAGGNVEANWDCVTNSGG